MRIILSLLCFFLLSSCSKKIDWNSLDKIYIIENKMDDFEDKPVDLLRQKNEAKALKVKTIKQRLLKSVYIGKNASWKGGSYYCLAYFSTRETKKFKFSANYAMYIDLSNGYSYRIEGYEKLGAMNWKKLLNHRN